MGILKDWWWDIALTLLTKVHPCCLKSQNFLMVFLKPPCLARWFSLRIDSWDFPILNQSHHKTANQRSHDQSQVDIVNFTPWLSLAPELRSIHLVVNVWQPKGHWRTGRCHHHVLWVEQDALHCTFVVAIEDAHFLSILSIPDMNSTIRWATEKYKSRWWGTLVVFTALSLIVSGKSKPDYKLRVWGKGGLEWQVLWVQMAREGLKCCSIVAVYQLDHGLVCRDEDGLAIRGKLQPSPFYFLTVSLKFKGRKGTLVKGPEIVEFDGLGVDASGKDKTVGVESCHRPTSKLHQTLAVVTPQVPKPNRLV